MRQVRIHAFAGSIVNSSRARSARRISATPATTLFRKNWQTDAEITKKKKNDERTPGRGNSGGPKNEERIKWKNSGRDDRNFAQSIR